MSLSILELAPLYELEPNAVIGVEDGKIIFANPAARSAFDVHPGESAAKYIPEHILDETTEQFSFSDAEADYTLVRFGGGAVVTIRPKAERKPLPSSMERLLNQFGGDLMTARLALDGLVSNSGAEKDPKLSQYSAALYRTYYRTKRLQSHMLLAEALSRDDYPLQRELCELDSICGELCDTVSILMKELDIELVYQGTDTPCYILASKNLVETMLLNLLSNSLQHTAAGGRIRVGLSRRGDRAVISVDDEGGGIAAEKLAGLFSGQPAYDLSDSALSAGLGLVIVRGIAEKLGGTLLAESREGKGTLLRLSIPLDTDGHHQLSSPPAAYRTDGMDAILTELSVVLDKRFYNRTFFD